MFLYTDVTRYPKELIRLYQDEGIIVGIAINPGIGINEIEYVLVLTCELDGMGQEYIKPIEDKIGKLVGYGVMVELDRANQGIGKVGGVVCCDGEGCF